MSIYNKIYTGFSLGTAPPVTAGIEDVIYIFNQGDFTLTLRYRQPADRNRFNRYRRRKRL